MTQRAFGFIVDHPKRDLPGAISFARAMARRGCDSYIVPFYEQATDVPLLPLDGLLVNFARPANLELVKGFRESGLAVFVLDTEGGNQTESGTNTPARLAELLRERGFSQLLDGYFFWGPRLRDAFRGACGMPDERLIASGCARYDYASPRFRGALEYPSRGFVLVNGNYPLVNPRFVSSESRERAAAVDAGWDDAYMRGLVADMSVLFGQFKETVARLARDLPHLQFLLRPHPFENIDAYAGAFRGIPNIRVDGSGNVLNVLAHASCMVHINCATAIESIMLGCPPISMEYLNTPRLLNHAPLPSRISAHTTSYEDLAQKVADSAAVAATFPFAEHYQTFIHPWYFENDGGAADRIADAMLKFSPTRAGSTSVSRSLASSRRAPRISQRLQSLLVNLAGSRLTSQVRARLQKARRDKLFGPVEFKAELARLCSIDGIETPNVEYARHPLTGVRLSSLVCKFDRGGSRK